MQPEKMTSNPEKALMIAGLLGLVALLAWQSLQQEAQDQPSDASQPIPAPPPVVHIEVNAKPGGLFNDNELQLFQDISFGSEHASLTPAIRKWTDDIVIRIEGDPTEDDLAFLGQLTEEINGLQSQIRLSQDYFSANLVIHFAPERRFGEILSKYQPVNHGFFWVRWIDDVIYHGTILIDSESLTSTQRQGTLREELTQSLGLMNASSRFTESIFNDEQGMISPDYAEIDRAMIRMLYRDEVTAGMTPGQVMPILADLEQ